MEAFAADATSARLWLRRDDVSSLFANVANGGGLGVGGQLCGGPGERVLLADYFRMSRELAFASREESLGLTPRPLVSGTADFVIAQAARRVTLAEAMAQVGEAYNVLHGGHYNSVVVDAKSFAFHIDDAAFPYPGRAGESATFMMECVLIYLHALACTLAGEDVSAGVIRIETRRARPLEVGPLDFWACPLIYGAPAFSLVYAGELARHPIAGNRLSEEAIHNRVLSLIERREHADQGVALLVRQALRDGLHHQHNVAARLGTSVATLRRKLSAEQTSFRALRRQILNETAHARLLSPSRLADVADDLGFSDSRSFIRAFKAWNGATPKSFRKRGRGH